MEYMSESISKSSPVMRPEPGLDVQSCIRLKICTNNKAPCACTREHQPVRMADMPRQSSHARHCQSGRGDTDCKCCSHLFHYYHERIKSAGVCSIQCHWKRLARCTSDWPIQGSDHWTSHGMSSQALTKHGVLYPALPACTLISQVTMTVYRKLLQGQELARST